jgi:hypothetical protein
MATTLTHHTEDQAASGSRPDDRLAPQLPPGWTYEVAGDRHILACGRHGPRFNCPTRAHIEGIARQLG